MHAFSTILSLTLITIALSSCTGNQALDRPAEPQPDDLSEPANQLEPAEPAAAEPPAEIDPRDFGQFATMARADSTVIYALHPHDYDRRDTSEERFHGHKIIGQTAIDPSSALELLGYVNRCIEGADGAPARCFNPRHGIRCKIGDQTIDLAICFECSQTYEFRSSQDDKITHLTDEVAKAEINRFYTERGLTIHQ